MIALLPMYDRPETQPTNDALWHGVRDRLGHGPAELSRGMDFWDAWQSPDLILAQTCGYPYRARLHGKVTLVVTPVHDLPDCPRGYYFSALVVRRNDPRRKMQDFSDAVLAYNNGLSQSGWAAPQNHAGTLGFTFTRTLETGGHGASALAVADGQADIAALDAITWAMMQRYDAVTGALRVLEHTAPTPALPYITAIGNDSAVLRAALSDAIASLSPDQRETLGLHGVEEVPAARYLEVPDPPSP